MAKRPPSKQDETTSGKPVRFSYSTADQPLLTRTVIKTIERMAGQRRLKKLYDEHHAGVEAGADFFASAVKLLKLDIAYDAEALALCPREGPVVFIANHPYGVLDGIALTWLAIQARPDVKVLANSVLCQAPEARHNLLPVDFAETREARETNVVSRRAAQQWLRDGHAVGIFPGGGVSTSEKPLKGPAVDLPWAPFTAKLVRMSGATVMPVFFVGQNSRLFQLASHLSLTLRLSLVFRETARRIGSRLTVRIGRPVPAAEFENLADRGAMVRELRRLTFAAAHPGDIKNRGSDIHLREARIAGTRDD